MEFRFYLMPLMVSAIIFSCADNVVEGTGEPDPVAQEVGFRYQVEEFADIKILRYQIP